MLKDNKQMIRILMERMGVDPQVLKKAAEKLLAEREGRHDHP